MKMPNDNEIHDKVLEEFFSVLKKEDNRIPVPRFRTRTRPMGWKIISMGIAASLLLFLWFGRKGTDKVSLEKDVVIISLVDVENQGQKFVIETVTYMDVWEAPTSSLLTEF